MTHNCPLCSETHDERTMLRIHLEVEHRKSEVVSCLLSATTDRSVDERSEERRDERAMPPA
jgi:hypothetical protein